MRRARPSRRASSGGAAIPSGAAGACAARSPRRRAGPAASCGWGTERSWRFRWSGGRPGARVNGEGCTGPSAVGWSTGRAFDPSTGGIRSAEGLDVADPLVPRLLRGAALLDAGQGLLHRVVDREVVGALVRRDGDGLGAFGEDLAGRRVVEGRDREGEQVLALEGLLLAREGTDLLEGLDLLLGRGQPRGELLGLLRVGALLRHGQVRTAPVATATGEGVGDVPALDALGVALDDSDHPAGAEHRREAVLLVARGPVVAPLLELGGETVGDAGLVDHALVGGADAVEEGDLRLGLELLAGGEVALPRGAEHHGDRLAVAGQA